VGVYVLLMSHSSSMTFYVVISARTRVRNVHSVTRRKVAIYLVSVLARTSYIDETKLY
jgi:hypothetical protein